MAKFSMTKPQTNGVALGGIGTGSVELWPDGEFHYWQIANQTRWGGQFEGSWEKADDGEGHAGALSFWIRTQTAGSSLPVVRKLGMKTDFHDFTYRMFAWNKPVERIDYDGRFPAAELTYSDRALPCSLKLKAVSPFVPHETDLSCTPGFQLTFTVSNPTDEALSVSLIGALEPSFINSRNCENTLLREDGLTAVQIQPASRTWDNRNDPDLGDVCFSVSGSGESTFLTADYFRFLREFVSYSELGVTQESFLFGFRETGRLPDTDAGKLPRPLWPDLPELTDEAVEKRTEQLRAYPFARSVIRRMRRLKPDFPADRADQEKFLRYCRRQMEGIASAGFGSAALGKVLTLGPGETAEIRFLLTWNFPNHFSRTGERIGHYYENLYEDSAASNRFLAAHPEIFENAAAFSDLLYRAEVSGDGMPEAQELSDCWSAHLSTIVKASWRLKNGKFGLWEGLGSCGFHTTDITYHASFGLTALFPELQLSQMRMGAAFQRGDGWVHHCFNPDLEHTDNGFDRVDMNPQFVLMVCRDYLFTGDRAYLDDLWENVIRAMDSIAALDEDGDGLPDTGTRRNTYDAWNFSGTPAYISILWLAALKAAVLLAEIEGDEKRRLLWQSQLDSGKAALEEKLFNGRYYDLWRTPEQSDGCLMTDQLDGEWFLRMAGIGGNLPDERVKSVMQVIAEANFDPEDGLVNATCPADRDTSVFTYRNCQAEACWTGVGYAFSAMAIAVGQPEFARREIRLIHENQARFGEFWSHWECGAWYTRPMSSWTTLIALSGMKVNAAEKTLSLDPAAGTVGRMPLCLPGVLAEVTFTDTDCVIECLSSREALNGWTVTSGGRNVVIR